MCKVLVSLAPGLMRTQSQGDKVEQGNRIIIRLLDDVVRVAVCTAHTMMHAHAHTLRMKQMPQSWNTHLINYAFIDNMVRKVLTGNIQKAVLCCDLKSRDFWKRKLEPLFQFL